VEIKKEETNERYIIWQWLEILFHFIFYTNLIGRKTHRTQNVPLGVFPSGDKWSEAKRSFHILDATNANNICPIRIDKMDLQEGDV